MNRLAARSGITAVVAGIFGIYLLTMAGHTYSPDEETLLASADALGLHATFAIPANRSLVEVPGLGGRYYSQYGPGQPVLAVPWVWLGHGLAALFGLDSAGSGFVLRFVLGSFNLLVAALLAGLLYALARRLGAGRRGGLLLAVLLAFSTFLWPMSRTFFAEPLTALLLFGAFAVLATSRRFLLGGLLAALVLTVKVQYVVALPALGLYATWQALRAWRGGDRAAARRLLGGFVAGGVLGLVPLLLYDTLGFGSPFTTGYHQSFAETFTTPLFEGLNGLLLSPGKGLWIYAPPVFLGLAGMVPFARRRPALAATIGGVVLPTLVLFALYRFWPGDGSWGPRYLIPLLPFLLLPLVALLPAADAAPVPFATWAPGRRLLAAVVLLCGGVGLIVQLLGVLVNFDTYINLVNDDLTRYWNATYSPVQGHWNVLAARAGNWRDRLWPGAAALLTGGVSYSEGDKYQGEVFPRWTTGHAVLCVPAAVPLTLTLRLADHRPPPLPRAPITVTWSAQVVPAAHQPVPGSPVESVLTATLPAQSAPGRACGADLALDTPTWNPKEAGVGPRNENLGLMIESLTLQPASGPPLRVADTTPIQSFYAAPRWYYDTQSLHLADLWAWYLIAAGLPWRAALPLAAVVLLLSVGALVWAIRHWRL